MNQQIFNNNRVEAYAIKFLADHNRNTPVTNETLEKSFRDCVTPANFEQYEDIKIRIEEMREDTTNYKFYDDFN